VWLICGFIFITFGKLLVNICRVFFKDAVYSIYDTFFIGIGFVGTILSLLSLWFPVNIYSAWGLVIFSILYIIYLSCIKKDFFLLDIVNGIKKWKWQTKLLVLLTISVVTFYCLLPPTIFDMRLYYLQSIIWNESYPVIPGLANIHGRFGFNSNILLLSSALSFKDVFSFRTYGVLGVSFIFLLVWIIKQTRASASIWEKTGLFFICFMLVYVYRSFLSAPSTDILPNILVIYVLLKAILNKDSIFKSPLVFWILPIYSITLKLSVIPVCLLCLPIIIRLVKDKEYKVLSFIVFIGFMIVAAWCMRTVIISGYLVYPYPSLDLFNVDWKVPEALAMEEKANVSSWAKMPGISTAEFEQMHFKDWMKVWLLRHIKYLPLSLFFYCLASISPIIILTMWKTKLIRSGYHILLWLVAFAGFVFWFILAPDGRFGISFILIAAIAPFLFLSNAIENRFINKSPDVFFILAFLFLLYSGIGIHKEYQGDKSVVSYLYAPQTIEIIDKKDNTSFTSKQIGDLIIYAPNNFLCSDHDIPCVPFFDPEHNLEMRGNKIEKGFRVKVKEQ